MDKLLNNKNNVYLNKTTDTEHINNELIKERMTIKKKIMNCDPEYNHKYYPNIISNNLCDYIINESEKFAKNNKTINNPDGWTHSRHDNYPTTDIPLHLIKTLESVVMNIINIDIFEIISKTFNVNKYFLNCNDVFIVKYTMDGQRKLEKHRDGSAFSFNILLNSEENFTGGGTIIEENGQEIHVTNTKGGLVLHSGSCLHQGKAIESGTRYLLVGFVGYLKFYDFTNKTLNELTNINTIKFTKNLNYENKSEPNEFNFYDWKIELNEYKENYNNLYNMCITNNTFLLNSDKNNFNMLEKFVYEMAIFHFKRMKIEYDPNNHWIEFWTKKEIITKPIIHNLHCDKDEKNFFNNNILITPLLSTVTYLTDAFYPTIITNISEKKENFNLTHKKTILLSLPKKMKHISFDCKYLHGVTNMFYNIPDDMILEKNPRLTIMFNLWDKKPLNIEYYNSIENNFYHKNYNLVKNITINNDNILNLTTEQSNIDNIIKNIFQNNLSSNFNILNLNEFKDINKSNFLISS